ncbi:TPA: restriction endonuclease subunit S, partial [Streptococcus pneumoniae]
MPKRYLLDGKTPRISATNIDNGILGYYEDIDDKNYRVFENFISVSFLGAVFYHKYKASLDMKIHCLKLKNKELNKEVAFYLTSIIRQALKNT